MNIVLVKVCDVSVIHVADVLCSCFINVISIMCITNCC